MLTMILVQQILKFTTITRHAVPIDALFDGEFPCAVLDISRYKRMHSENLKRMSIATNINKINSLLEHIVGWNISMGGAKVIADCSKVKMSMVRPAAIIAPKHDGNVVCGRSTLRPHRSASSCSRNGFSLNSPPTVMRSKCFHDGTSFTNASMRSRVWKQIASYAASMTW